MARDTSGWVGVAVRSEWVWTYQNTNHEENGWSDTRGSLIFLLWDTDRDPDWVPSTSFYDQLTRLLVSTVFDFVPCVPLLCQSYVFCGTLLWESEKTFRYPGRCSRCGSGFIYVSPLSGWTLYDVFMLVKTFLITPFL